MKRIVMVLSGLLMLAFAHSSFAACARHKQWAWSDPDPVLVTTVALPDNLLVESRDYNAGEVVYNSGSISGSPSSLTIEGCGRNYVVGWFYNNSPQSTMAAGGTIAPTNITGLGVRVTTVNQAGPFDDPHVVDNNWIKGNGQSDHTLNNSQYRVELVATGGPIVAGTLTFASPLAQVDYRESASHSANGDIASQLNLGSTNVAIKAMGCMADTSLIRFTFGTLNLNEFAAATKVGNAPDQPVTLTCEPGTNVSLSLVATEATGDNANHTVIALTGSGTEGVASGVGVQLGLKTSGYDSGGDGLPLNQAITLFSSQRATTNEAGTRLVSGGSGGVETLTFSAKYYKTAATVGAGTAYATAVINLTYN